MERNILKESCYSINKAVQILNNNGIVALKAETVYGIACNANSIFSIESGNAQPFSSTVAPPGVLGH